MNGFTITPKVNLVENIGFNERATHTKSYHSIINKFSLPFPLKIPTEISRNKKLEKRYFDEVASLSFMKKILIILNQYIRIRK